MAERKKCDYCGKIYYKDGFLNELGSASGVGDIVGGVRDLSRIAGGGRNFCSTKCKNAYNSQKGGGSTGGGGNAAAEMARRAEQEAKSSNLQIITTTTYDNDSPEHIVATMESLVARTDEFKNSDESFIVLGKAVQKKLEEGIYKLKKNGIAEDDYYLKQALKLKKQFDKLLLKKRRTNPMLMAGMMTFLVSWLALSIGLGAPQMLATIVAVPLTLLALFIVMIIIR